MLLRQWSWTSKHTKRARHFSSLWKTLWLLWNSYLPFTSSYTKALFCVRRQNVFSIELGSARFDSAFKVMLKWKVSVESIGEKNLWPIKVPTPDSCFHAIVSGRQARAWRVRRKYFAKTGNRTNLSVGPVKSSVIPGSGYRKDRLESRSQICIFSQFMFSYKSPKVQEVRDIFTN